MFSEDGAAHCGIEKAYNDGVIDWKKPISCHLYPIRIARYTDFEALNYDRWSICSAACSLGEELKVPVYKFLKDPLIRKYGPAFYEKVEIAADLIEKTDFKSLNCRILQALIGSVPIAVYSEVVSNNFSLLITTGKTQIAVLVIGANRGHVCIGRSATDTY